MTRVDTPWPVGLFDDLDRAAPIPLYFQVSSRLEAAILDGRIPSGSRLENEIALGHRLGVSRPTVRRAIQELVDKGLLVRRRGVGTQVVHGRLTRQVELTSLFEDLERARRRPSTRVLTHERRAASEEAADALDLAIGTDVLVLRRLRLSDGVPVAILANHLPAEVGDVEVAQLERRGLYQILRSRGVAIRVATQRIGARRATHDEARLLEIDRGGPILSVDRVAFDATGRAIELGQHCYRPDMYSFETTLVAR